MGCDTLKKGGGASPIAYEINGKKFPLDEVQKANMETFYELEKKKADIVQDAAKVTYLDIFFSEIAKKENKSKEEARKAYIAANIQITDQEVDATLQHLPNSPNLAKMTNEQKRRRIRDYLEQTKGGLVLKNLVDKAIRENKLIISYQAPEEPRFNLNVASDEIVRFGPSPNDINPLSPNGCNGDDCAVTVVEYSEFQCPYCSSILPIANQILEKYKGKIRWVVRNFPLDFHPNARPSAIAAACAAQQKKFWQMYEKLFANQQALDEEDLFTYAEQIGLDMNYFSTCYDDQRDINKIIDEQIKFGQTLGVSGTPVFFINGRKISGILPYESFDKIIEEELAEKN